MMTQLLKFFDEKIRFLAGLAFFLLFRVSVMHAIDIKTLAGFSLHFFFC